MESNSEKVVSQMSIRWFGFWCNRFRQFKRVCIEIWIVIHGYRVHTCTIERAFTCDPGSDLNLPGTHWTQTEPLLVYPCIQLQGPPSGPVCPVRVSLCECVCVCSSCGNVVRRCLGVRMYICIYVFMLVCMFVCMHI